MKHFIGGGSSSIGWGSSDIWAGSGGIENIAQAIGWWESHMDWSTETIIENTSGFTEMLISTETI